MKNQFFIYHHPAVFDNGFTLIEVLVTLIVLSVGLLSLAGLQVFGLRTSHSASLRTQATIQSYDIIDRMRANLRGVQDGNYNKPTQEGSAGDEVTACEAITGTTNGCSTQDMASHDPVSYTHLDVYKRQELRVRSSKPILAGKMDWYCWTGK